jgi:hypothetical protein
MSQETGECLRKAIDDVENMRKRQNTLFFILFCVMVGLFIRLGYMVGNPATVVPRIILFAVFVLFFGMIYAGTALAMVQSRMTLKVLKAIELLSKQSSAGGPRQPS